ncbi:helix-turn-helix domain-containing protein, partial [Aeromonas molluscorum]
YRQSSQALASLARVSASRTWTPCFGSTAGSANPLTLPKGIDALTLERILSALAGEGASAEEIGARVGVSRTTARRYLEFLVGQQLASPELEYGTVGRPERRYRRR